MPSLKKTGTSVGSANSSTPPSPVAADANESRLAVTAEGPCVHNAWQRVRKLRKSGGVLLRCFECGAKWATEITMHHKCPDFYRGKCTVGNECPHPHIYARGTYPTDPSDETADHVEAFGSVLLKELRERTTQKRRSGGSPLKKSALEAKDAEGSHTTRSSCESDESDKRSGAETGSTGDSQDESRFTFRHDPYSPSGTVRCN